MFSESLEFTLNFSASEKCFSVSLVTDGLVEDTENITLSLQQIMTNTSFGIRDINPNTTTITVTDEDCEFFSLLRPCMYCCELNVPIII